MSHILFISIFYKVQDIAIFVSYLMFLGQQVLKIPEKLHKRAENDVKLDFQKKKRKE